MVDYDKAVATVQDPNADPVLLAKIAYENPEFGANVAVNPRCYPGLKRWLATFGDERARQTLAQMGVTAEDGPVADAQPAQDVATDSAATSAAADQYSADSYSADQYSADSYAASAAQQQPAQDQYTAAQYAAQQEPQATNPYGYTAQMALETTDQELIAKIAQYAPELRPCIARNPSTYPALVDWLAQLNDPAVNAALATRQ